jgi:hypothetical protein
MLFNREAQADAAQLRHTTLATSRLRFLFVAAKIWHHAGRTGVLVAAGEGAIFAEWSGPGRE